MYIVQCTCNTYGMYGIHIHYVALRHIICGEHYQHIVSSRLCQNIRKMQTEKKTKKKTSYYSTEWIFSYPRIRVQWRSDWPVVGSLHTITQLHISPKYQIYYGCHWSKEIFSRSNSTHCSVFTQPDVLCVLCTIYATCDLRSHWTVDSVHSFSRIFNAFANLDTWI